MDIILNEEKLSALLKAFSNICKINIGFIDVNGEYRTRERKMQNAKFCREIQKTDKGRLLCRSCDISLLEKCKKSKSAETHICHAGLIDIAIPIVLNGDIIGFNILGQLKTKKSFCEIYENVKSVCKNEEKLREYYDELTIYDEEKICDVITVSTAFSKYLFMENIFKLNSSLEKACFYIKNNLKEELSIQSLEKNTGISKSTLYKYFKLHYNCTVGEYINKIRIEKSAELLLNADLSMDEIAESVGFSSASYYSKVFKKFYGISPLKYKKENKKI